LRVLDETTLGFADFGRNREYITLGNLAENERAFLFFMDYERRRRLKVWGRARVVEGGAGDVTSAVCAMRCAGRIG
jgi:predicted pyridoxine 5'-phosphate oxidase superfamily flavin-nucleotide-binding protein